MTTPSGYLERRYRWLLRCYPKAWRRRHDDEMVAVLLDEAEAAHQSVVTLATAVDLIGHGAEERLESQLRWLPTRLRTQISVVALIVAAGLALVMLVGEVIGAHDRPPPDQIQSYGQSFISGPFLTIGVGLYLALMTAVLLVVRGHGGHARLLLLGGVAYAAWMRWTLGSAGYPTPRLLVLALFAALGLLAVLVTIRPTRPAARAICGFGAAFVAALVAGLLLTGSVQDWNITTIATFTDNAALGVLATVFPFLGGAALLTAALASSRRPGWVTAITVTGFPVVVFCSIAGQVVNPGQADGNVFYPLCYLLGAAAVTLIHQHGRRSPPIPS